MTNGGRRSALRTRIAPLKPCASQKRAERIGGLVSLIKTKHPPGRSAPRDRSNEEILVNSNEVSEGSKAYGECERLHKREVTRVGTNEMDRWITGCLPNPPSSLHEHTGAEVNTHYKAVAASAESPNPSARPAADIDGIIDLSDNR